MSIRIGIVGFGKLGLMHSALFNAIEHSRVAAIADMASPSLKFLKSEMSETEIFEDYRHFLEKKLVDAVVVATPTLSHSEIALDVIRRGLPVFIEKPLSTTASGALPLINALESRFVPNMVGYMNRFLDTFAKGKDIIRSGALGELRLLQSTMYVSQLFKKGNGWRYSKQESGGGVFITQNSHLVDMLLWYFGDIEKVSAQMISLFSGEVEDAAHVFLHFKNGLKGWIDSSWSVRNHRTLTMSIHIEAENGTLCVNDDEVRLQLDHSHADYREGWTVWKKPDLYRSVNFDLAGAHFSRQAEAFVQAILTGKPHGGADIPSAYMVQQVIDSAYRSSETGCLELVRRVR